MKVTQDTNSTKLYGVILDSEAFEFNDDIELKDADIEYYVFSETFQAWVRSSMIQMKREFPATYSEIHSKLINAYQNYLEDQWMFSQRGNYEP